jgi:hypothetical protein
MNDIEVVNKKRSSTEKLNELLGIQSIDDVLNELSIEKNDESFVKTLDEIDDHVRSQMEVIKSQGTLFKTNSEEFNVHSMESALNEVSGLIDVSKAIIQKIYDYVATSDLLDPDIIAAGAKMIEAARIAVSDYVDMYKNQIRFFNMIQLEMIKQKHKKELLDHKLQCDIKKAKALGDDDKIEDIDMLEYTQESIVKALRQYERDSDIAEAELVED